MPDKTDDRMKSEKIIKYLQVLFPNKKIEELPFNDINNKRKNPRYPYSHEFIIHLETVCSLLFPPEVWGNCETETGIHSLLYRNRVKDLFIQGETEILLGLGKSG